MSNRRLTFTFGLRALLLAFTVLAIAMGWIADRVHQRQAAVELIRTLGGQLSSEADTRHYRENLSRHYLRPLRPGERESWPPMTRTWNERILGDRLTMLRLGHRKKAHGNQKLPDPAIPAIGSLHELRSLSLSGTDLNDDELLHLRGLQRLEYLYLNGCPISDRSAETLSQFHDLRWLELNDTLISDDAINHLLQMKNLELLRIRGTRISDHGIARFCLLSNFNFRIAHGQCEFYRTIGHGLPASG